MNNDDQKIVWNKGTSDDAQSNKPAESAENSGTEPLLGDETIADLVQRAGDSQTGVKNPDAPEDTIIDIKDDINSLLGDVEQQLDGIPEKQEKDILSASNNDIVEGSDEVSQPKTIEPEKTDSTPGSPAVAAAMAASTAKVEKNIDSSLKIEKPIVDKKSDTIDSIKESIKSDLDQNPGEELDENTKKLLEEKEKKKGIEQTYYSDISNAMGSNEPATMSELLRKSRFEKKEKEIFSPRSKKNIAYIVGTVLLLGLIIGIVVSFFGKKEVVQYITEKKVESIVYSDLDTGINSAGIETEKTKQAIRKVVETKLAEDTIHQIYYVDNDKFDNLRRLGIRQVFDLTDNVPPDLLYENVENQFMHGVYKTDKNQPFVILKALSYDRAFEGMKEWEPTIIDDLSTYLDLPPEAGDRSLLEAGFSDDLIKNKTVRVARFLPREVDRRGIFGIFNSSDNKTENIDEQNEKKNTVENIVSFFKEKARIFVLNSALPVFAQIEFLNQDGGTTVIDNSGAINTSIPSEREVCFRTDTGEKTSIEDNLPPSLEICFDSYQCVTYECTLNGQAVNTNREGEPGVMCGENRTLNPDEVDTYAGQKICRSYPELLNIQNINNKTLCFDVDGNYIEGYSADNEGYLPNEINCILPINRDATMCVDNQNKVVFKDPTLSENTYKFCVAALDGTTKLVDEQFQQNYGELQEKALVIGLELKALALLLDLVNIDGAADTLNEASEFFLNIALGNIQEDEIQRTAIGIVSRLDRLLSQIDPTGELSYDQNGNPTTIGRLRDIIDLIKGSFGYKHNVGWVSLGNGYPNGFLLPPGGIIYPGEIVDVVEPIQQTLVLIGLMDSVSVTGQLDLVTQDAISSFQALNGLEQTGVIDTATINVINNIISGAGSLYDGSETASIDDYFDGTMGLGEYSEQVQWLQILLYAEGYDIDDIDGLYDDQVCQSLRDYQADNDLDQSDTVSCSLNAQTLESLNNLIRFGDYLGTGFNLATNGSLQGFGNLQGQVGPGSIDFGVNTAEADSLKEGDIVLMYTFLDEETILITRHESVITEIIKRRAFNDIFNK